jgi:hypothetical protein
MNGYKVRLGDGSEIGPMDLPALKTWIAQGLVDRDSPVMRPGTRRWTSLGSVPELKGLAGSHRRRAEPARGGAVRARDASPVGGRVARGEPDRWRVSAVGALLFGLAALMAVPLLHPERVLPAFDSAPWLQLALGSLALGLALLPGWNLARRAVRVVLLLAGFALFAVAGVLIAQGERGGALLAIGSAWLLVSGLLALLAPSFGWRSALLALVPVLAGAVGMLRFGSASVTEEALKVREWASAERRYADDSIGLTLVLPAGWVALRAGNPLLPQPPDARLTLAQPRLGGFAWLISGPAPQGVATAEQYLDRVLARRRGERPGYTAGPQANAIVGALSGRRATAAWLDGGIRHSELVVAALDGWTAFALVAWMPEAGAGRGVSGLEPLAAALSARGLLAGRLHDAVAAAVTAVPHLTPETAQQLMARSEARVLEPEQAFRRSVAALAKLLPSLTVAESRELASLSSNAYQGVSHADRTRLASYFERVRRGDTTTAGEDREMAALMKVAEEGLAPYRLTRLRAYYDKAVQASR